MLIGVSAWSFTGLAGLLHASSAQKQATAVRADAISESRLLELIGKEIGGAPCKHTSQCRALPIGEKSCGGPSAWMAWSSEVGQAESILAWGRELGRLQQRENARLGATSTCQHLPDPGAICQSQRCVLQPQNLSQ